MKAHKVELLIVDHDGLGSQEITDVIENIKYPNWCIYPEVKSVETKDIGEWNDDHALNQLGEESDKFYQKLFNKDKQK